jgi:hypothetical protein
MYTSKRYGDLSYKCNYIIDDLTVVDQKRTGLESCPVCDLTLEWKIWTNETRRGVIAANCMADLNADIVVGIRSPKQACYKHDAPDDLLFTDISIFRYKEYDSCNRRLTSHRGSDGIVPVSVVKKATWTAIVSILFLFSVVAALIKNLNDDIIARE